MSSEFSVRAPPKASQGQAAVLVLERVLPRAAWQWLAEVARLHPLTSGCRKWGKDEHGRAGGRCPWALLQDLVWEESLGGAAPWMMGICSRLCLSGTTLHPTSPPLRGGWRGSGAPGFGV